MGKPETDLAPRIREKTLELLMEKDPEAITVRDIAKACGVTATSVYYYYRDREALFMEVKLGCITEMNRFIANAVVKKTAKSRNQNETQSLPPLIEKIRIGLEAFRDWAFDNPRVALLVMGRLPADIQADPKRMELYYRSNISAKTMLDEAVKAGISNSSDTLLDANLCIAALWGAIESTLLNRTMPKYWTRKGAIEFTNKMIDLLMTSLMSRNH